MIEKILDKYYLKKLKIFLDRELLLWNIDHKYIEELGYLTLLIKKECYNDKQYKELLTFHKKDIFNDLCNQKELINVLKERMNEYFEKY